MTILLDEDLPQALSDVFQESGYTTQCVATIPALRGKPDEVIFDYACKHGYVLATADLGIPNPIRFPLSRIPGLILFRFPSEMPVRALCAETTRLIRELQEKEYYQLLIIEPGFIRLRPL